MDSPSLSQSASTSTSILSSNPNSNSAPIHSSIVSTMDKPSPISMSRTFIPLDVWSVEGVEVLPPNSTQEFTSIQQMTLVKINFTVRTDRPLKAEECVFQISRSLGYASNHIYLYPGINVPYDPSSLSVGVGSATVKAEGAVSMIVSFAQQLSITLPLIEGTVQKSLLDYIAASGNITHHTIVFSGAHQWRIRFKVIFPESFSSHHVNTATASATPMAVRPHLKLVSVGTDIVDRDRLAETWTSSKDWCWSVVYKTGDSLRGWMSYLTPSGRNQQQQLPQYASHPTNNNNNQTTIPHSTQEPLSVQVHSLQPLPTQQQQ